MQKGAFIVILAGIILLVALKLSLLSAGLLNISYLSLSFFPLVAILLISFGFAILVFDAAPSGILALIAFIISFLIMLYIAGTFLGFGSILGFKMPTGLP